MRRGDLLVPNDYMRANGSFIYGIVLEKTPYGHVKVFLTNGTTHWKDEDSLLGLFNVIDMSLFSRIFDSLHW